MTALKLEKLKPGMILDNDIKNFSGKILVRKGTCLTEKHIKILKAWGNPEIYISGCSPRSEENGSDKKDSDHPELLQEARQETAGLFRYANKNNRVVKLLMRLCISKKLTKNLKTRKTMSLTAFEMVKNSDKLSSPPEIFIEINRLVANLERRNINCQWHASRRASFEVGLARFSSGNTKRNFKTRKRGKNLFCLLTEKRPHENSAICLLRSFLC